MTEHDERDELREALRETKVEHGKAKVAKTAALTEHRRLVSALKNTERAILRAQQRRHL